MHCSILRPVSESESYLRQAAPMWTTIPDCWSISAVFLTSYWPSGFKLCRAIAVDFFWIASTLMHVLVPLFESILPYMVMTERHCKRDVSIGLQEHSPTLVRSLNQLQVHLFCAVFLIRYSGIHSLAATAPRASWTLVPSSTKPLSVFT
jgi:hypothetical protein